MVNNQTNLSYVHQALDNIHNKLKEKITKESIEFPKLNNEPKYILFLSIGNPDIRARVYNVVELNLDKAMDKIRQKAVQLVQTNHLDPKWIKIDLVTHIKVLPFDSLEQQLTKIRRNYYRSGIAFDSEFRLAFLEQEINGFALIRKKKGKPQALDEVNINNYIKYKYDNKYPFAKRSYKNNAIYTFKTQAFFVDNHEVYELYSEELTNGIRKIDNIEKELHQLITNSTYFLVNEMKANGKFNYGYFPCFNKEIKTYNILRHCSTLYAMSEAYEYLKDETIREAIERGIEYLIKEAIVYVDDRAFVVDVENENEIKLGSNAHAILALTKYMQATNKDTHIELARALGRAIIWMQNDDGGFLHVWEYPSIALKDAFRTVYYDGEAVFALLRLYELDPQDIWLHKVEDAFEFLIKNKYWKYHDHWLSYAANELITYVPKDKYFIFGLKNCQNRLDFIYHRETTYPTFLELTMAAFKMVRKIEEMEKDYLFEHIDRKQLLDTIDRRAEYQRVGFNYPEIAMYFKNPKRVLNSFFIRHQAFRVRIDDIEHNLSGYIHYLLYRVPELKESKNLTIANIDS